MNINLENVIEMLASIGTGYVVANGIVRVDGNSISIHNDKIVVNTPYGRTLEFSDLNMLSYFLSM